MSERRDWKIGIWCAVSSRKQAEDTKVSLPEQERMGRELAAQANGDVVKVYRVPGHSRSDYVFWWEAERDMPAYAEAREDIESGKVNVIHCVDPDRLGRNAALISQFYSLAERYGAEIFAASMPHQLGNWTAAHRYMSGFMGARAHEFIEQLVHKHRQGMRGRVQRGLHAHKWPIGYKAVKNEVGETVGGAFDDEIGAVDLMTRLFLEGQPYTAITRAMDDSPYAPPRGGVRWDRSTIRHTLDNDTYAGYVHWGGAQNDEPSELFPARWDGETYAAVIRERVRRKRAFPTRRSGPLRGVAVCMRCGRNMSRHRQEHRNYLRCSYKAECHSNYIREDLALQAVAEFVQSLADGEVLDAALEAMAPATMDLAPELERLLARAEDLGGQRRRIALAFAGGRMDPEIYFETDQVLSGQLGKVEEQLREVMTAIEAKPDVEARRAELEELVAALPALLAETPAGVVATRLHHAGVRVFAEEGTFVVGLVA